MCADGGANRLYDALQPEERVNFIPDVICGDLDSARKDVLDYYQSKGSEVVRLPDQDNTDFSKAVQYLVNNKLGKNSTIVTYNMMTGRGDQVFGCLQSLYEAAKLDPSLNVYLLSDESVCCLLQAGKHVIPCTSGLEEGHCGLIPLGEPVHSISTTGLKWDLQDDTLSFGGLISTCNLLNKDYKEVTIVTSHPVLWTISHILSTL